MFPQQSGGVVTMIKYIVLVLSVCLSCGAFATNIEVFPSRPLVFSADTTAPDGSEVKGPWFSGQYTINADEDITVSGLHFEVRSVEGTVSSVDLVFDTPQEIGAGQDLTLDDVYIG